jgi:hypothetical protein
MLPRREAEGNRAVEERDDGVEEVGVRVGVHLQAGNTIRYDFESIW